MTGFGFASLGSGSRGNATLICTASTRLLVDCGFAARELLARCAQIGFDPGTLDAVLVTHEHGDHVRGVGPVARRLDLAVWMTAGTWRGAKCGKLEKLHLFGSHDQPFRIGDILIEPVPVPHDAREPTQFIFHWRDRRIGLLTDLGSLTPHVCAAYDGVDALLLECNHDLQMLRAGPYPPALQARVGGRYGHLNNLQAAELLSRIDCSGISHLVAAHLSEKNNAPELARDALLGAVSGLSERLTLLSQDRISPWFALPPD